MSSPFSRSALVVLVIGSVFLFALSFLLQTYDDKPESTGIGAQTSSYNVSAIGYAGLYETLSELGLPVKRSLGNTLVSVGTKGMLVVAEPGLAGLSGEDSAKLLLAPRLLLVLPKWAGYRDQGKAKWVSRVEPKPLTEAQATLALVVPKPDVLRTPTPKAWTINQIGITPTLPENVQLIRGEGLKPVVGTEQGMLVGEWRDEGRVVWIVADPDLLSNHGFDEGENAAFALALFDKLRWQDHAGGDAPIIFDETVHGYRQASDSPIKMMFRFPFIIITLLVFATTILLLLAATRRFGVPRVPPREIDFGKRTLVGNSARLLDYAGYHGAVMQRYIRMTIRMVAQALHAPKDLNEPSLLAWLDQVGQKRGVERSCADIVYTSTSLDATNPQHLTQLFAAAREIYLWKGDILNGPEQRRKNSP